MSIGKDSADFIVDMISVSAGIEAYETMMQEMEALLTGAEEMCGNFPLSSWSGEGREEFFAEAITRMNEFHRIVYQMDETTECLSDLLKGAKRLRKQTIKLKNTLTT